MIEVKLEDFDKYRKKLIGYAKSLFHNRGFTDKDGEAQVLAEDSVQEAYLHFHKYDLKSFVSFKHLENVLFSLVYKEYLEAIDLNRKGAQYILLKKHSIDNRFKEEFKQLNIRSKIKATQDEFDVLVSFSKFLDSTELSVLNKLIEGFSQVEISKLLNLSIDSVNDYVNNLRVKYLKYDNKAPSFNRNKDGKIKVKKPVLQYNLDGTLVKEWDRIIVAANKLDLCANTISAVCKGKRLTHGGYKWKYKEEYESTNSKM